MGPTVGLKCDSCGRVVARAHEDPAHPIPRTGVTCAGCDALARGLIAVRDSASIRVMSDPVSAAETPALTRTSGPVR